MWPIRISLLLTSPDTGLCPGLPWIYIQFSCSFELLSYKDVRMYVSPKMSVTSEDLGTPKQPHFLSKQGQHVRHHKSIYKSIFILLCPEITITGVKTQREGFYPLYLDVCFCILSPLALPHTTSNHQRPVVNNVALT